MADSPQVPNQPPMQGAPDGHPGVEGQFVIDTTDTGYYGVLARGLPYDATKNEVAQFFSSCRIRNGKDGIHILMGSDGRPQGDALVELEGEQDLEKAKELNNQSMGRRYIEVSVISRVVAENTLAGQPGVKGSDFVVRLRGLPYSATSRDVINLLHDCKVTDSDKGIRFSFAPDGRPSGEAFVELASEEDVSKALEHNNEHMGKRYVEIFKATKGQLEWEGRMAEKVGGGTGGVVRLRGLPYRCTEEDIRQFFQDMSVPAGGVTMQVDSDGRETGEAYVEFTKAKDAENALHKDRQTIGHRYIEVFRSTHAEIRPVAAKENRWSRGSPYSRPGQLGDRGAHGGYGGYSSGGYGAKLGSGYDRGGRGRGRGERGGMSGGGYDNFGSYPQYPGGYDYNAQPGFDQYGPSYGGGGGGVSQNYGSAGNSDPSHMVAYPPIRPTQGGRGGEGGEKGRHAIKMRGLPYSSKEKEIEDFFLPHVAVKVDVDYDQYGRPSGEAEVTFNSHEEAEKAMEKHNGNMGHRYIELFLMSHPSSGGGVSGLVGGPVGGGGGGVVGGGVGRGGLRGGGMTARYPAQASWTDPRGTQPVPPQGVYNTTVHAQPAGQPQQPQQYLQQHQQQTHASYQQPPAQGLPGSSQQGGAPSHQWPQQGGYQQTTATGGYQQQQQQPAYQQQPSSHQQQQSGGYQQPGQEAYPQHAQPQPQTQWY